MSWVDKIQNGFIINTGDGKQYTPAWLNASFVTEYQTAEFNFIGVSGSLVKKELPIGIKYNLEIYFQGPDHLDTSAAFRVSCNSKQPWIVEHPLYDRIIVQITSLTWDNSQYNVTKITGTMIETIEEVSISNLFGAAIEPIEQIPIQFETATDDFSAALTETPTPADINTLTQDNIDTYKKGVPIITLEDDFETYTNAFNTASTFINTATATPLLMMRSVINVITLPAQFTASVKTRIGVLIATFDELRANLYGLLSVSAKQLFQNKQGATICALCKAASTPLGNDYKNSQPILEVIESIVSARAQFIEDLDTLQTANAGSVLSFVANAQALTSMNNLVNTTISALFNLSLSARSERSIYVSKDTNWILLAHQLYGLDSEDQNINDLIEENIPADQFTAGVNILHEYLQVEKGRKVVYYI